MTDKVSCTKLQLSQNQVEFEQQESLIAQEGPLQISINDIPYTITMRTPGADNVLIHGLLYTEKVFAGDSLILKSYDFDDTKIPSHINAEIPADKILKDITNNRSLISSSSCGFCGKKDLKDIELRDEGITDGTTIPFSHINNLFKDLSQHQHIFKETGGVHAAALYTEKEELLSVYEDIGRHNAVDKVIGQTLKDKRLDEAKVLLVTGRVSYEILVKALRARVPIILAISAPSSLAIEMAKDFGVTIAGFCRGNTATIYSHPERILTGEQ